MPQRDDRRAIARNRVAPASDALQSAHLHVLRRCAQPPQRAFLAKTTPFALGRTTPDTELLFVVQRVLETLRAHLAVRAHCARGLRRTAALGEEDLGIHLATARVGLPLDRLKKLRCDALHAPTFPLFLPVGIREAFPVRDAGSPIYSRRFTCVERVVGPRTCIGLRKDALESHSCDSKHVIYPAQ